MVRRDVDEILASEQRVEWTGQERELWRYGLREGVIAEVKYNFWETGQKTRIHNPFELEYPRWIPKGERTDFGPRQYGHTESCGG
jgi:hypothetical protein